MHLYLNYSLSARALDSTCTIAPREFFCDQPDDTIFVIYVNGILVLSKKINNSSATNFYTKN